MKALSKLALNCWLGSNHALIGVRHKLTAKAPEILIGLGMTSMVGAVVTSAVAGAKATEILEDHEERLEEARPEDESKLSDEEKAEAGKKIVECYIQTGEELLKDFAIPATLTVVAGFCFIKADSIRSDRLAEATAAYMGLREQFRKYRENNIDLNGEENDKMCCYGYEEVEEEDENGNVVKKKVAKDPVKSAQEDADEPDRYHMLSFDKWSAPYLWKGNANDDLATLEECEEYLKRLVYTRGYATIWDMRYYLGMELSTRTDDIEDVAASIVDGWVRGYGPDPDLGFRDDPDNAKFLNKFPNQAVYLCPNIHGNVYDILMVLQEERDKRNGFVVKKGERNA